MANLNQLIGKRLVSVQLEDGKEKIAFILDSGERIAFGVEGDCCSHSWIEHLEDFGDVTGATVLSVDDSGGTEIPDPEHECLQVYRTLFHTDRGDIVLEYRNSSNGYYGGYLVDAR